MVRINVLNCKSTVNKNLVRVFWTHITLSHNLLNIYWLRQCQFCRKNLVRLVVLLVCHRNVLLTHRHIFRLTHTPATLMVNFWNLENGLGLLSRFVFRGCSCIIFLVRQALGIYANGKRISLVLYLDRRQIFTLSTSFWLLAFSIALNRNLRCLRNYVRRYATLVFFYCFGSPITGQLRTLILPVNLLIRVNQNLLLFFRFFCSVFFLPFFWLINLICLLSQWRLFFDLGKDI